MKYYVEGYDQNGDRYLYMDLSPSEIKNGSISYHISKSNVIGFSISTRFINSLLMTRYYLRKQQKCVCGIGNFKIKKWE